MRFQWDEAKPRVNIRKHSIDFLDIPAVFEGNLVTVLDDRFDYGETRYLTLGVLKGRLVAIAHTESNDVIRIISARKATRNEEKSYFEQIAY